MEWQIRPVRQVVKLSFFFFYLPSILGTKGSIAGIIQGQGVAVGPICIGGGVGNTGGRKSLENPHQEEKDFRDSSRSHDYPRSATNDNYVDENYLLQGGGGAGTSTRHNTKKVNFLVFKTI